MQILFDYLYDLNWFAVIVATCAGILINTAWYSNTLFGKPWMKAVGLKKKDINNGSAVDTALVISFGTLLISTAALAVLVQVLHISGALNGVLLGTLVGFGFMAMNLGMHQLYEQRPFSLFIITAVGDILTMAAIGAILAVW